MIEPVTIPISSFELIAEYQRPMFQTQFACVLQALFEAVGPWEPRVEDVDALTSSKLSENGINLKLPMKQMSIFFGHGHCRIVRDGISWQSTEETVEILNAAVPALCGASSVTISRQRASIAMHIQLRSGPFIRTLRPLISTHLPSLEAEPIQTMAAVVKWQNRKVTIDGSAAVANGVFLRLEREFSGTASYSEIATQIRSDQDSVFELLGVGESQA